jgi:hypothetical protein
MAARVDSVSEGVPQSPVQETARRARVESFAENVPQSPVQESARRARVESFSETVPQSPVRETARRARVESFSDSVPQNAPIRERRDSSPKEKEKPSVRFKRGAEEKDRSSRPTGSRTYSNLELSTIDQKWGTLFDRDRNPTPRLGQFLRGLANHVVSAINCIVLMLEGGKAFMSSSCILRSSDN